MRTGLFIITLVFFLQAQAQGNALFAYVTLETSMGEIQLKLFKKDAPRLVDNFLGLISGRKAFRNSKTGKKVKDTPFYQNMVFHKVSPNLGIQTGCPWGSGKGWPGFTVKSETNDLKFDRPYRVAMSMIDGDPNSVGSQFFITTVATPHLDGKYTVIGDVQKGQEIVQQISRLKTDAMMKPIDPPKLIRIRIDSE